MTLFFLADRDVCCYPGGYFYTCTQGCNGVNKPLSECAGRDTCYTCGDWSQQCTAGSFAGKFHTLLFSSRFKNLILYYPAIMLISKSLHFHESSY